MSNSRRNLSLDALDQGIRGTVVSINCSGPIRRRLMDMGLTPGTQITVDGTAPLGDPIIICARGCRLALRQMEAAQICVEPCCKTTGAAEERANSKGTRSRARTRGECRQRARRRRGGTLGRKRMGCH
ncbi:MAG: ferrous iron transport protein A [Firmicutes bacterium]|jgi:ferrous iron transport protein A|nr:ferrous iron transport protein A [Bacillota bacterium]